MLEHVVAWEWDAAADRIVASAALPLLYGVRVIENVSRGLTLVHPDDHERHQSCLHAAVDRGRGYRSSFRIIRPDTHAEVLIDERAEAIGRGARQPTELIGLAFDATIRQIVSTPHAMIDALDALEEFGDVLLAAHAGRLRRAPRSQRVVRGAWVAAATREFAQLAAVLPAKAPKAADAIRAATTALRERLAW